MSFSSFKNSVFRTKVKICGITNLNDAICAVSYGADALGFIFYDKSPRFISREKAKEIVKQLPPFVTVVGVFVNASFDLVSDYVQEIGLNCVQLHSLYQDDDFFRLNVPVITAVQIANSTDLDAISSLPKYVRGVVLDTKKDGFYGGTGEVFDWQLAIQAKQLGLPVILSGGLTPENVRLGVEIVTPFAIDVSSGLESEPGKKSPEKMKRFFDALQVL